MTRAFQVWQCLDQEDAHWESKEAWVSKQDEADLGIDVLNHKFTILIAYNLKQGWE